MPSRPQFLKKVTKTSSYKSLVCVLEMKEETKKVKKYDSIFKRLKYTKKIRNYN